MAAPGIQAALAGTKPWVRLMSVLGFVSAALMIVIGVGAAILGAMALGDGVQAAAFAIIYPITGLLYLVPSFYLYRYATRIGDYVNGGQELQLELALDSQRAFWKFVGVLSVIGIVFACLGLVAAILIPVFLRGSVM